MRGRDVWQNEGGSRCPGHADSISQPLVLERFGARGGGHELHCIADGREETSRAGDVYYWPAGHTGWTDEGVTFLEFSPTDAIMPVLDHLSKQLAAG